MYNYNLPQAFEAVAAASVDRPALRFEGGVAYTYGELQGRSRDLAGFLNDVGLGRGDIIAISGHKCFDAYAAILACLRVGAAYVVLDPESPSERLRRILSTCGARLLLGETALCQRLNGFVRTAVLEESGRDRATDNELPDMARIHGGEPAYVMFTSGSTGNPKGAVMSHANVRNLIAWAQDCYAIGSDDRLTNLNPLYFDNSVFDVYAALFSGACLVVLTREETRDPRRLVDRINAEACTVWFSVPSLMLFLQTMRAADGRNLRSIRRFIFGGEGYPKAKLKALFAMYGETSAIYNVYGPTECTCICSSYRVRPSDFDTLTGLAPLGELAPNFTGFILDDALQPVAPGESGELCLSGPNVGLGYLNDAARSQVSFIQNPLNPAYREIVYRTGDMVRADANGMLHILGRKDNQIKHMGYRIELEEIEAALHAQDAVAEAVALHRTRNGLSQIVGIIASLSDLDEASLRAGLRRLLPDYMVPQVFYRETELPKNQNGKVDRQRLAAIYGNGAGEG
jgi:D-alanine--poly(phosphoribitol) ligase subunit 1